MKFHETRISTALGTMTGSPSPLMPRYAKGLCLAASPWYLPQHVPGSNQSRPHRHRAPGAEVVAWPGQRQHWPSVAERHTERHTTKLRTQNNDGKCSISTESAYTFHYRLSEWPVLTKATYRSRGAKVQRRTLAALRLQ